MAGSTSLQFSSEYTLWTRAGYKDNPSDVEMQLLQVSCCVIASGSRGWQVILSSELEVMVVCSIELGLLQEGSSVQMLAFVMSLWQNMYRWTIQLKGLYYNSQSEWYLECAPEPRAPSLWESSCFPALKVVPKLQLPIRLRPLRHVLLPISAWLHFYGRSDRPFTRLNTWPKSQKQQFQSTSLLPSKPLWA